MLFQDAARESSVRLCSSGSAICRGEAWPGKEFLGWCFAVQWIDTHAKTGSDGSDVSMYRSGGGVMQTTHTGDDS